MGQDLSRVERLLRIVHLIHSKSGLGAADIARELGCSERNVYRDIRSLNEIGIPCFHDPETGGYRVRNGFFMPPVDLTFEEALTLCVLLEHVPHEDQIPFFDTAQRAIEKIRSQLPEVTKEGLETLDEHIEIHLARGSTGDGFRDVYEDVRQAIATRRILRCRYDAAASSRGDADAIFELRPYCLVWHQRGWYVVGHHSGRDEIRNLKLNRFDYVELTDRPYLIPEDFSLRDYLGNAWRMIRGPIRHQVAVRFEADFADTVTETRWHPTQREEHHDDGRVTLRFQVDGLSEILYWVLGYGPGATVLEPKELAEKVRNLARATAARYDTEAG